MPSLTTGVFLLLSATLHVCSRKDDIFRMTEEALGLKRRDFELAEKPNLLLRGMSDDNQEKFYKMAKESIAALNFVRKLIINARAVATNQYNELDALRKLRELYQNLPVQAATVVSKYFPKLTSALNGTSKPWNNNVTGNQGSHSSSTTTPGHSSSTTNPDHSSSTTTPGHISSTATPSHSSSTTTGGNLNKPISDIVLKQARVDLMLAKTNLQELSLDEKYKKVRNKIDDLLNKEPKDWNGTDLREALQSFLNGLKKAIGKGVSFQDRDFKQGSQFLNRVCRAFTHRGACNIASLERRINNASTIEGLTTPIPLQTKIKRLVNIIQSVIDDLDLKH